MDLERETRDVVAIGRRGACTDAERRAANHLARRLEALGRRAEVETVLVRPHTELTHILHALMGVVGSAVSVGAPRVGLAITAVALVSAVLDLSGSRLAPVRLLTFRRSSQNVFSPSSERRRGAILLVAGTDAPRHGALRGPALTRARQLASRVLRREQGLAGPFVLALGLVTATALIRVLDVDSQALSAVQFAPTVALLLAIVTLGDHALSPIAAGEPEAGAVALVLALAEELEPELEHFAVHVVFGGAERAGALGMRAWLRHHRHEHDATRTIVVSIDRTPAGRPAYRHRAGALFGTAFHPAVIEACEEVARRHDGVRVPRRSISAALAARLRRYPAGELLSVAEDAAEDEIDAESLERMRAFARGVLLALDERVGPQLAEG